MKKFFAKIDAFLEKLCSPKLKTLRVLIYLLFDLLSLVGVFLLLFSPICLPPMPDTTFTITAAGAFSSLNSDDAALASFAMLQLGCFIAIIAILLAGLVKLLKSLLSLSNEEEVAKCSKDSILIGTISVVVYTAFTYFFSPINSSLGGYSPISANGTPLFPHCGKHHQR